MITELLAENQVESYRNASSSPDLSFRDFFVFSKLKNQLRKIHFNNDDEMLDALDNVIGSLIKGGFQNCFSDKFSRTHKCVNAEEEYFEKN